MRPRDLEAMARSFEETARFCDGQGDSRQAAADWARAAKLHAEASVAYARRAAWWLGVSAVLFVAAVLVRVLG